jgi:hypothetical protein
MMVREAERSAARTGLTLPEAKATDLRARLIEQQVCQL